MSSRTPNPTTRSNQPRKVCGRATASYSGVVAKAREIWQIDGQFECVVDAAWSGSSPPTKHDRDNAAVTSLVFSRQPRFRHLECRFATLRYANGVRRRIAVSLSRASDMLSRAARGREQLSLDLPSPLVGFLCSSHVRRG